MDELTELQIENARLRNEIEKICDDLDLDETRKDLWGFINLLVDNEIEQEKFCNQ